MPGLQRKRSEQIQFDGQLVSWSTTWESKLASLKLIGKCYYNEALKAYGDITKSKRT